MIIKKFSYLQTETSLPDRPSNDHRSLIGWMTGIYSQAGGTYTSKFNINELLNKDDDVILYVDSQAYTYYNEYKYDLADTTTTSDIGSYLPTRYMKILNKNDFNHLKESTDNMDARAATKEILSYHSNKTSKFISTIISYNTLSSSDKFNFNKTNSHWRDTLQHNGYSEDGIIDYIKDVLEPNNTTISLNPNKHFDTQIDDINTFKTVRVDGENNINSVWQASTSTSSDEKPIKVGKGNSIDRINVISYWI